MQLQIELAGTSAITPGRRVTTAEIVAELFPDRDPAKIIRKTGIDTRWFADKNDTAADLGTRAIREALDDAGMQAEELERIILVTSGVGDLAFPATANLICAGLGLQGSCDCFDINNACLGFLSAFDLAARSVATGGGPVGIAVVELATRCMTPADTRPYLVFGDAVAGAVVRRAESGGMLGSWLRNDGVAFGNVRLDNPVITGKPESISFTATSDTIAEEAVSAIRTSAEAVLEQQDIGFEDIEWILPHQPNGALFQLIVDTLGIPHEKIVPVVNEIGSSGAAAIPFSLARLYQLHEVKAGDRILMVGVGGGISYGAILYEQPAA